MFEAPSFDGSAAEPLRCAHAMDEVWVPTAWHKELFSQNGVPAGKIYIVPEAVDPTLFAQADDAGRARVVTGPDSEPFTFFSNFKWERRKGWDVLLEAYWRAFGVEDNVRLRIRSFVHQSNLLNKEADGDLNARVAEFATSKFGKPREELAAVEWVGDAEDKRGNLLTRSELRDELAGADAFVLPTRGEGWGLPVAEAMTMGLPTIVSNWSGPAAFATSETAYLLPVAAELDEDLFAQPSVDALAEIFRRVYDEATDGR